MKKLNIIIISVICIFAHFELYAVTASIDPVGGMTVDMTGLQNKLNDDYSAVSFLGNESESMKAAVNAW